MKDYLQCAVQPMDTSHHTNADTQISSVSCIIIYATSSQQTPDKNK